MKNGQEVFISSMGTKGRILMVIKEYNTAYVIVNKERYILDMKDLIAAA